MEATKTNRKTAPPNTRGQWLAAGIGVCTLLFGVWAFAGCAGCKTVTKSAPVVTPSPKASPSVENAPHLSSTPRLVVSERITLSAETLDALAVAVGKAQSELREKRQATDAEKKRVAEIMATEKKLAELKAGNK